MNVPTELIAQFCGVTNADESLASQLLRDSGLDLESAIHSFFAIQEAGGFPNQENQNESDQQNDNLSTEAQPPQSDVPDLIQEDEQPQPLPVEVETLLPTTSTRRPRTTHFDDPFTANTDSPRTEALASLFRPPMHLLFSGNFDEVQSAGQRQKRWILVNMQRSDDFASLSVNRDIWSDPTIQQIIQVHFLFWQRDERADDAERYRGFYPYSSPPHIAIIDPRTAERVRTWGGDGNAPPLQKVRDDLAEFVTTNSLDSDDVIRNKHRGEASTRAPQGSQSQVPESSAMDLDVIENHIDGGQVDEDAQLAAAIAASMEDENGQAEAEGEAPNAAQPRPNGYSNYLSTTAIESDRHASRLLSATDPTLNKTRSLRAEQDNAYEESLALDRAKEESERMERERQERVAAEEKEKIKLVTQAREQKRRRVPSIPSSDCKEPITAIAIRLPNGKRLQRKFLASNNVGNVYDFIEIECEDLQEGSYELMQSYPRKTFSNRDLLLSEFPPKAALIVHLKD